ncbi:DUF932 domain-containing protein [Kutzneria sp. 744]|uniref:DUF932 domain-containing protein n=1 Tax=Kutzneria sp. (strain 744) TaxID=345341 RepID=UPI0003EEC57F|nr:DUF932 domain-containing protein [Kutzneria sp. 744]EWM19694.1 phage/plasmid-related protein [Kutzneria sp. 744]
MTTTRFVTPPDQRRLPWLELGTDVSGAFNAYDAMVTANLTGWDIRKLRQSACEITEHGAVRVDNPDKVMLVYTDPATHAVRYLSTVGDKYGIHQNEAVANLIDALVADTGAAGCTSAGTLHGGRQVYVTMTLPHVTSLGGFDNVRFVIETSTSHDGTAAFRVRLVPYRQICTNGLHVSMDGFVNEVTIRHTSNSQIDVEAVRAKLPRLYEYAAEFENRAARMLETRMSDTEFDDLITAVWHTDSAATGARAEKNAQRRNEALHWLWRSADTQAGITGTRWGAFQAITEHLDHSARTRRADDRATRVLTSSDLAKKKQKAFVLLTP